MRGKLRIGIVGLGPDAGRLARAAAGAVRGGWGPVGAPDLTVALAADDARTLARLVRAWADRERYEAIFTVGRAGPGREDFAPEATARLLDRDLPGVEERMHLSAARNAGDLLFRGRAGMRGTTLLVNLPERPPRIRVVAAFLAPVLRHAVEKARGDERPCAVRGHRR